MALLRTLAWIVLPFTTAVFLDTTPPDSTRESADGTSDSLSAEFLRRIREIRSPELERRNAARHFVQRSGYCLALASVLRDDGLGAAFAVGRMRLHLEFFLPHDQVLYYAPIVSGEQRRSRLPGFTTYGERFAAIPLYEDWTFPDDPWSSSTR
jgi:hypothetical protein